MKKKTVVIDKIKYLLNGIDMTAVITSFDLDLIDINIPISITYESKEYDVNGVKYSSIFKSMKRMPMGFLLNSIKSITIPSSFKYFASGWCDEAPNLTEINVSTENKYFSSYNNQFIIGKSLQENTEEDFDVLIFCVRNVKNVTIPKFIKIIGSYSFQLCKQLDEVIFEPNSKLEIIEKYTFQCSSIKTIKTPPNLKVICRRAFDNCDQLTNFEIPMDSEIHTIQKYAFCNSSIESINITSKLVHLEKYWCMDIPKLNSIKVSPDNQMYSSYEDKYIIGKPLSYEEQNEEEEYNDCEDNEEEEEFIDDNKNEEEEEFLDDNENETNDKYDEFGEEEESKNINGSNKQPDDKKIQSSTIYNVDSNEFNVLIFSVRNIVEATIPSFVELIGPCSFNRCNKLQNVKFLKDSKLQTICEGAFYESSLKCISIPINVTLIQDNAFSQCNNLEIVEIPTNSKMQKIKAFAFNNTGINKISIPASLVHIEMNAFALCERLAKVDIPKNSQLQKIDYGVFQSAPITSFFFPASLDNIEFNQFENLKIVETDENFENVGLIHDILYDNENIIIMIPYKIGKTYK